MLTSEISENRLAKRTGAAIRSSFLELLKERPVNRIYVSDLCRLTDINRSTFYAHFVDIYDLMECLKQEVLREIEDENEQILGDPEISPKSILDRIFALIYRNRVLLQYELLEARDWDFGQEIHRRVQRLFYEKTFQDHPEFAVLSRHETENALLFLSHGYYAIYAEWLRDDCRAQVEDVVPMAMKLTDCCIQLLEQEAQQTASGRQSDERRNFVK